MDPYSERIAREQEDAEINGTAPWQVAIASTPEPEPEPEPDPVDA